MNHLVVLNLYTLVFQELLHEVGVAEVMLPGKMPVAIHHAMGGYKFRKGVTMVESPSYHARGAGTSYAAGYGTVTGYPAGWDLAGNGVNFSEEVIRGFHPAALAVPDRGLG